MAKRKSRSIHPSIRECLGYSESETDAEIFSDWKERTSRVCKPCWELKYCPYGPLVEQSPLLPITLAEHEKSLAYYRQCLNDDTVGQHGTLSDEFREYYTEWLDDEQIIYDQAERWSLSRREKIAAESRVDYLESLGEPLPAIEKYRVAYNLGLDSHAEEINYSKSDWSEIRKIANKLKRQYKKAIRTGYFDDREPMDDVRRRMFSDFVTRDTKDYPDHIDPSFTAAACNIFGHICPVFFTAEVMTETEETRRIGRRQLPFSTMMRIVRRDDYRDCCQFVLQENRGRNNHPAAISHIARFLSCTRSSSRTCRTSRRCRSAPW